MVEPACQCWRVKRWELDPWVRRSPRRGQGNPLPYSCLKNPMDRGAWQATAHGVTKSWTQLKCLSMHAQLILYTEKNTEFLSNRQNIFTKRSISTTVQPWVLKLISYLKEWIKLSFHEPCKNKQLGFLIEIHTFVDWAWSTRKLCISYLKFLSLRKFIGSQLHDDHWKSNNFQCCYIWNSLSNFHLLRLLIIYKTDPHHIYT